MSPTHTNKGGARYRYYVSQAVLQKEQPTGSISRVPAPEVEALVISALRNHVSRADTDQHFTQDDRELVERYLDCVTVTPNEITVRLRETIEKTTQELDTQNATNNASPPPIADVTRIAIPWTSSPPATIKGIVHVPAHNTPIKPGRREALLIAIAKARNWMNDLADGRVAGFAAIARREGKAERHIRLLAPLAFLWPRIVSVLIDGTAPGHLTVTRLARALPYSWAEQEQQSIAPTYSQLGCEPGG
jgi:site-specific DNA recombinase